MAKTDKKKNNGVDLEALKASKKAKEKVLTENEIVTKNG